MGWLKRGGGKRKYYCRSVRENGKTHKAYVGGGDVGNFESRRELLREYDKEKAREAWIRDKEMIQRACDSFLELDEICNLLRDATLLSEGFARIGRHPWKESKLTRKILDGNIPGPDHRNREGSETTESSRTSAIEGLAIYESGDLESDEKPG